MLELWQIALIFSYIPHLYYTQDAFALKALNKGAVNQLWLSNSFYCIQLKLK